jgi:predicted house-cleaning noncanonical NTP pyrophosphatase (MazG superfamily)
MSKLVRDKIPAIIRSKGCVPVTRTAGAEEYRQALFDKLTEEAGELRDADREHAPGELADILEVVYALAADHGVSRDELEGLRQAKHAERGGFAQRVIWDGNHEPRDREPGQ